MPEQTGVKLLKTPFQMQNLGSNETAQWSGYGFNKYLSSAHLSIKVVEGVPMDS